MSTSTWRLRQSLALQDLRIMARRSETPASLPLRSKALKGRSMRQSHTEEERVAASSHRWQTTSAISAGQASPQSVTRESRQPRFRCPKGRRSKNRCRWSMLTWQRTHRPKSILCCSTLPWLGTQRTWVNPILPWLTHNNYGRKKRNKSLVVKSNLHQNTFGEKCQDV